MEKKNIEYSKTATEYSSTRNACKLCSPLGACLVFKGIEGCVPMIHGSQGCATYIRRYLISHFREPMDIASTNFSESATIFGGNKNFCTGLDNIIDQYHPKVLGISTTCLSETIGEDVQMLIKEYKHTRKGQEVPVLIHAETPSYQGSHMDGFFEAVYKTVKTVAVKGEKKNKVNIFPGFISPEDIRYLKEILNDFEMEHILFPDYSETLDNTNWEKYINIPSGGTPVNEIEDTANSIATIELGKVLNYGNISGKLQKKNVTTAGKYLKHNFNVPLYNTGLPVGITETDKFISILENISNKEIPEKIKKERGRLVDAYVDAHKYLFGKKAVVYGEEDLVIGLVHFLREIGINVILAASGGQSGLLQEHLNNNSSEETYETVIGQGWDFEKIAAFADISKPDIFIGNSKAYYITRKLGIPLVRVGFPIHDRFGGQRIMHLGYRGTQQLFDRITNAILEYKQENSPVGYKYL